MAGLRGREPASSIGEAGLTTFLLFGVVRWTFDGEAYLAQEVWAGALLVISVSGRTGWGAKSAIRGQG